MYVDHDSSVVSAQEICEALNLERFGARVEHDAGTEAASASAFLTSILAFEASESEAPTTERLTDFLNTIEPSQMETFLVDIPFKKITVVHNPLLLSAREIVDALLEKTGLQTTIVRDGADHKNWEFPEAVEEEAIEEENGRPRPTVIASGVFWIISMLSFIGGDW